MDESDAKAGLLEAAEVDGAEDDGASGNVKETVAIMLHGAEEARRFRSEYQSYLVLRWAQDFARGAHLFR
jgi:hypothetical protein